MSFSLLAQYKYDKLTDIAWEFLSARGISLLMLDLDNTLAAYGETALPPETLDWAENMRRGGILLYIVSNSKKSERVGGFADALGIPYVIFACKPSPRRLREVMEIQKVPPRAAAIAGDQIFTDTLAGNLAGATAILIKPLRLSNILLAVRYALEAPFRALSGKGK